MSPAPAILLTSTPFVSAMVQAAIPAGHEATSYWISYGSFAIMAWAAYGMLKQVQKQAAEERKASEERAAQERRAIEDLMAKLVAQVLANESRGYDVIAESSERMGELTGVIRRCAGQPRIDQQFRIQGQQQPAEPR